jgi:hypothetical protein
MGVLLDDEEEIVRRERERERERDGAWVCC